MAQRIKGSIQNMELWIEMVTKIFNNSNNQQEITTWINETNKTWKEKVK